MRASPPSPVAIALGACCTIAALTSLAGCLDEPVIGSLPPNDTSLVPLSQLAGGNYRSYPLGLYEGANAPPGRHATEGAARANAIAPRDTAGAADAGGKYVLLSIGPTNTALEFCSATGSPPCADSSFIGQAAKDTSVNHTALTIVNGAAPDAFADAWASPGSASFDRIRDSVLTPAGLSERQVEIVWANVYDAAPAASLPSADADVFVLERRMGNIVRALKVRYPNLSMAFFSSRIWGGYATTTVSPEPYAYESGFAVKWLIQAQIDQMDIGVVTDTLAGNLSYTAGAPWIAWGPYLWALADQPSPSGLQWLPQDFQSDGTTPSTAGVLKVSEALLGFFEHDPRAACWFRTGGTCHS